MAKEAVDALECENGKLYIDATLGGGGYSELILQRISPSGKLISFDVDIAAINASKERLKDYENLTIVNDSYTNIKKYLQENNIKKPFLKDGLFLFGKKNEYEIWLCFLS